VPNPWPARSPCSKRPQKRVIVHTAHGIEDAGAGVACISGALYFRAPYFRAPYFWGTDFWAQLLRPHCPPIERA